METAPRTNLTASSDRLHARGEELLSLRTLLVRGARLLTLTGIAGVGKTRLARELGLLEARSLRWTGGVWFVSCAECSSPEALSLRIAETLELPGLRASAPAEALARALAAAGNVLLVLDNLEAIAEEAGPLAARWLSRTNKLSLLTTSRVRLGHELERAYELAPLPVQTGAVPLFLERVRRARANTVPLSARELEAATSIATQLGGLPLALELAAARASLLGLEELRERLERDGGVLEFAGSGGRTLPTTLGWSALAQRDYAEARRAFERSIQELSLAATPRELGLAWCGRGLSAFFLDETAVEALERSAELLRECAPGWRLARTYAWLAVARRKEGQHERAMVAWSLARSSEDRNNPDGVVSALAGVCELWLASEDREKRVLRAQQTLATFRSRTLDVEERLAVALLEQVLEREAPVREALQIAADGRWFCVPGGERVDLSKLRNLRLLLSALTEERLRAPGAALSFEALIEAGWPGEKLVHRAAYNRLHVAISTLRKRGLHTLLRRIDEGWLLDPTLACVRVP